MSGIFLGSDAIKAVKVGDQDAKAVYLGAELVWPTTPTLTYDQEVLADSPEAYWPLQGNSSAAVVDVVNAHNFTAFGSPSFGSTGPRGWDAVAFDGSTQYLLTSSFSPPLGTNSTMSFELWFRSNSPSTLRTMGAVRYASELSLLLLNSASNGQVRGYRYGTFRTAGAGSLNDGAWHHRVDVVDGTNYHVYIDGALLQSGTTPVGGTAVPVWVALGANYSTIPHQHFAGWLTKAALYDSVLSAERVAAHYAALT